MLKINLKYPKNTSIKNNNNTNNNIYNNNNIQNLSTTKQKYMENLKR